MFELSVRNLTGVLSVSLGNHAEDLFLCGLLAHHLEDNAKLICIDLA